MAVTVVLAALPAITVTTFDVSAEGAPWEAGVPAWRPSPAVPVAVAESVNVPGVLKVVVQVYVQVAPTSRVVVVPSELLWKVTGEQFGSVTLTPEMTSSASAAAAVS